MTSTNYLEFHSITLQFELDRNIDGAARDVQAAINAARGFLPANLPSNPYVSQSQSVRRTNPYPCTYIRFCEQGGHVRCGLNYPFAETLPGERCRPDFCGRKFIAGGTRGPEPNRIEPIRDQPRRSPRRAGQYQCKPAERSLTDGDKTWEIHTNDQLQRAVRYVPLVVAFRIRGGGTPA